MRIIRQVDCKMMPWRNGGGSTTEVICEPPGAAAFDWRMSVADVTLSGPFSRFEGYDRHIAVIQGKEGMQLQFSDGRMQRLEIMKPFAFSGDTDAEGLLSHGPVRDLNLIVRRGYGRGHLTLHEMSDSSFHADASGSHLLIYMVRGSCMANGDMLAAGDAVHLFGGKIALAGAGMLAACKVVPA